MKFLHLLLSSLCLGSLGFTAAAAESFPVTPNIKGLQVQMVDDALKLGIHHAGLNVSLGSLFYLSEKPETTPLQVGTRTLHINNRYLKQLDADIRPLSEKGVVIYLILLAYPTRDAEKDKLLIHPDARADGKYTIGGFQTATEEGRAVYSALIELLAARYSKADSPHGKVWGWIVGNEVNSQWMWYNLGKKPVAETVDIYETAVRLTHQAVTKHSPAGRCYLSFDHHWTGSMPNISAEESYPSKAFLDAFAALAKKRGDFPWHVAQHPYADDLGNPRTWLDKDAPPHENARHITFKNLEVLVRYLKRPEMLFNGTPRSIILSEQGIHCLSTPDGEQLQAAGFAYAWEKASRLPGIDAMIWHRHVDHAKEGGLRLGLWTFKPNTISDPDKKRQFYDLFLKAGTPEWSPAAEFALPIVGMKDWAEFPKP